MNPSKLKVLLFHSLPVRDIDSDPDFRIAPIGLFFIAGALKQKGIESLTIPVLLPVFLEESATSAEYRNALKKRIKEFDPNYIGYSFRNLYNFGPPPAKPDSLADFFCISQDLPVIRFIRECSGAKIIAGGSGFSLAPEFYMTYLGLDYGIQGEGEQSIVMLLDNLKNGHPVDTVPGLVYRIGHSFCRNQVVHCEDHGTIGMDLSCLHAFRDIYYANGGYGAIQTKRGCSFKCSYCVYPYLEGQKYRQRPVQKIIEEIKEYHRDYDIRHIYFVDSVFSNPSEHSLAIVEAIIDSRLDISWYAYVNPSDLTMGLLKKYRESGCAGLVLTLESGCDEVLKCLKKGFSKQDSVRAIENLIASGIPFEVSMLAGSPGESGESLGESLSFCRNHLRNVPVVFTPGVWMHPVSSVFSDYFKVEKNDSDILSGIILSNDFRRHNDLYYFFADSSHRMELIRMLISAVDEEPLWFILGRDIQPDYKAGVVRYPGTDRVTRYARPWYGGLVNGLSNCLGK